MSAVLAALHVVLDDGRVKTARLAFGGMAGVPARALRAEAALTGLAFTPTAIAPAIAALTEDFTPLSDMRPSAEYRLPAAQNLLRQFCLAATGGAKDRKSVV